MAQRHPGALRPLVPVAIAVVAGLLAASAWRDRPRVAPVASARPTATEHALPQRLPAQLPPATIEALGATGMLQFERARLDHRLRTLHAVHGCLAGSPLSPGRLRFLVHFERVDDGFVARAVAPLDSTFASSDDDQRVLACVERVVVGATERFGGGPPDADAKLSLQGMVSIPIETDPVFAFLRTGRWQ